jgi:hypothetical protein
MAGCNWAYKKELRSSRFSGTTLFGVSEFNASDTCLAGDSSGGHNTAAF